MKNLPFKVFFAAGFICSLFSCGKPEKSSVTPLSPDPFLTTAELSKGSKIKSLTKAEAEVKLKGNKGLFDDGVKAAFQIKTDDCLRSILNSIPVKSYGTYLGVGAEADISKCAAQVFGDPDYKTDSAIMRIAFQFGCNNQDFSAYDGKTFGEISSGGNTPSCVGSTTTTELTNIRYQLIGSANKSGRKVTFEFLTYSGRANASGQPCLSTLEGNLLKLADGCRKTDKTLFASLKVDGVATTDEGLEDFSQLESSGVGSASGDNVWYESGKMNVTINNWTGNVTYKGGNTAPDYSVTNGSETASGTISSALQVGKREIIRKITDKLIRDVASAKSAITARNK